MSFFQAFILGVVQGITEYLPISSSAHFILISKLLGCRFQEQNILIFNIFIQFGTLFGVILYFYYELKNIYKGIVIQRSCNNYYTILGYFLIVSTIPVGLFGFYFKNVLSVFFSSLDFTIGFLFLNVIIMLICEFKKKKHIIMLN